VPNKTIYVSDEDVPTIDQVSLELPGSLSSNIVAGLRLLLSRHQGQHDGFDEVTLTIEEGGAKRQVVFSGRCVARSEEHKNGGKVLLEQRIYATVGGRFVYYERQDVNWNFWSDKDNWDDPTSPEGLPDKRLFIVAEKLDDLAEHAPDELVRAAETNGRKPAREYLDI
jgi:EXLDI family protein